jgi:hypothetical protein
VQIDGGVYETSVHGHPACTSSSLYFWDGVMQSKINDMALATMPLRTECIGSVGTSPNILYTGLPISKLEKAL